MIFPVKINVKGKKVILSGFPDEILEGIKKDNFDEIYYQLSDLGIFLLFEPQEITVNSEDTVKRADMLYR